MAGRTETGFLNGSDKKRVAAGGDDTGAILASSAEQLETCYLTDQKQIYRGRVLAVFDTK